MEKVLGEYKALPRGFVRRTLRAIRRMAEVVELPLAIGAYVTADPNDNPIVQTAITGKADCVLTADKTLLSIVKIQDVEFITLAEFESRLPAED